MRAYERTIGRKITRTMRQNLHALALVLGLALLCMLPFASASEAGSLTRIDSSHVGATIPLFLRTTDGATATLVMLPGGAGGFGSIADSGWPDGGNFLVRSAPLFAAENFNIAIMGRRSDMRDMNYDFRVSSEHIDDIRRTLQAIKQQTGGALWLVGTSRGTVSGTAAAIALRDEGLIDGLVLTSSVTNYNKTGAVGTQDLARIAIPVLVMHHAKDACPVCRPYEVPGIMRQLTHTPIKQQMIVDGGSHPLGDPCGASHYHGYIGMEQEAVKLIADWVKHPVNGTRPEN